MTDTQYLLQYFIEKSAQPAPKKKISKSEMRQKPKRAPKKAGGRDA